MSATSRYFYTQEGGSSFFTGGKITQQAGLKHLISVFSKFCISKNQRYYSSELSETNGATGMTVVGGRYTITRSFSALAR